MIRRLIVDNERALFLIPQTIHAQLSGQMALRFGNASFAQPLPRDWVIQAIAQHDSGWPMHDEEPTVNADGIPVDAFEMPIDNAMAIWAQSAELASAIHPYSGLLVSLHGLHLSLQAMKPGHSHGHHAVFAINRFQHAEIERQTRLREQLGFDISRPLQYGLALPGRSPEEDMLLFNFHVLQWMDRLSLDLCFDQARFARLEKMYSHPGNLSEGVSIERLGSGVFRVLPWPFDQGKMSFSLAARRVPSNRFESNAHLRAAWESAPWEQIEVILRA